MKKSKTKKVLSKKPKTKKVLTLTGKLISACTPNVTTEEQAAKNRTSSEYLLNKIDMMEKELSIFEEKVVSFIYELNRDYNTSGEIETVVRNSESSIVTKYTNEYMEQYARSVVKRLKS